MARGLKRWHELGTDFRLQCPQVLFRANVCRQKICLVKKMHGGEKMEKM